MTRGAAAAVVSILWLAASRPAAAGERELLAAARAGDRAALRAEAHRAGAAGLARLLAASDRETRQAALAAAALAPEPWVLAPALLTLASGADRPAAAAAARALAEIGEGLDRAAVEANEAPVDELAVLADGCGAAARRADLAPDVRVHTLACATGLLAAIADDAGARGPADDLLGDPEPEVRLAAVYAAHDLTAVATRITVEDDLVVAASAGAAVCRARAGASLSAEQLARVRTLAGDPMVEPGVVIGLLACLRDTDPADRAVRDALAKKGPKTVREHIRQSRSRK